MTRSLWNFPGITVCVSVFVLGLASERNVSLVHYTGNGQVARIVCAAAVARQPRGGSEYMRVLEYVMTVRQLGGKSPVVIDPKCNLKMAAKRIMWGKCANAGQTCVAPDYILVQEDAQDKIIQALKEA